MGGSSFFRADVLFFVVFFSETGAMPPFWGVQILKGALAKTIRLRGSRKLFRSLAGGSEGTGTPPKKTTTTNPHTHRDIGHFLVWAKVRWMLKLIKQNNHTRAQKHRKLQQIRCPGSLTCLFDGNPLVFVVLQRNQTKQPPV